MLRKNRDVYRIVPVSFDVVFSTGTGVGIAVMAFRITGNALRFLPNLSAIQLRIVITSHRGALRDSGMFEIAGTWTTGYEWDQNTYASLRDVGLAISRIGRIAVRRGFYAHSLYPSVRVPTLRD